MPKRQYYLQSRRGNRLFELGLGEVALRFCAASDPASQVAIDAVLSAHGPGAFASAWLEAGDLAWAAAALAACPQVPRPTPEKE